MAAGHQILDAGLGDRDGGFGRLQNIAAGAICVVAHLSTDTTRRIGVLGDWVA
jgi:hypothetical protein